MKEKVYVKAIKNIESLIEGETDLIAMMSTISCELYHAFESFSWVGFYRRVDEKTLKVGPYQGTHGCLTIDIQRGVCGKCAREGAAQIENDVNAIPHHIACSSDTKSEIVIPVKDNENYVRAVLDIDSREINNFDETDLRYLQKICETISGKLIVERKKVKYVKYHGLGNDYLVIRPEDAAQSLDKNQIQYICDRNYGVGSDGILLGPFDSKTCDYRLRILNPDGSEAEKSGNGLRIFSRYLYDIGLVHNNPFTIETLGGVVTSHVKENGKTVTVDMGKVSFLSSVIPVAGEAREVLREQMKIADKTFEFCAATVGNPHCIILSEHASPELAREYGPLIEVEPRFPNRTNVQFLEVMDRGNIRIEIWERGAGYTLASGSSSTAAAGVAYKLGLCDPDITVHMPGGNLAISFSDDFAATMTGPVTRVCEGIIDGEMFKARRP